VIEQSTINGRPALVAYLQDDFSPAKDQATATLVKVIFTDDEGGSAFLVPAKDEEESK
jgi:hypothetical protein